MAMFEGGGGGGGGSPLSREAEVAGLGMFSCSGGQMHSS